MAGYVTLVFQRDVRVPCPLSWARLLSGDIEVSPLGGVSRNKGARLCTCAWLLAVDREDRRVGRTEGPQDWKGVVCVEGAEGVCGWVQV